MNDCPRFGKLLGGCKFEGRWDYGAPTVSEISGGTMQGQIDFINASKPRKYVRDVCVRCGRTVDREQPVSANIAKPQ